MSRIGKKPILIPQGVEVKIDGQNIAIKGPKGELKISVRPEIKIEIKEGYLWASCPKENQRTRAFWGLTRALLANMIKGVVQGYETKLQIEGIGYKANTQGDDLVLEVGFSHPIKIRKPESIKFTIEKNIVSVSGIDKQLVGQIAAKIRAIKPPEPYKGTGIRYFGEIIKKKAGKKVVTAGET